MKESTWTKVNKEKYWDGSEAQKYDPDLMSDKNMLQNILTTTENETFYFIDNKICI